MFNTDICKAIENAIGTENVIYNELLNTHTTFRTGGPADVFAVAQTKAELSALIRVISNYSLPYMVIGNGSNLLVSDEGYRGVMIKLGREFEEIKVSDSSISAGAGVILSRVCMKAKEAGLSGLEFAYGIPGTVGGAMVMNAGAYDGEMKNVVKTVTLMNMQGETASFTCEEMKFSYRHSLLKEAEYIVLDASFELVLSDTDTVWAKMQDFMERRKSKQPLEYPSAGSTFKRPEGYFAGKLIQDAGLAGKRIGGACVSTKHCGFIVNDMGGTSRDINDLMAFVSNRVKEDSGVVLEPEVIKVGIF